MRGTDDRERRDSPGSEFHCDSLSNRSQIGQKKWYGSRIGQSLEFLLSGKFLLETQGSQAMNTDSDAGECSKQNLINVEENETQKEDSVNTSALTMSETNAGETKH